jgi:hypothetical protein
VTVPAADNLRQMWACPEHGLHCGGDQCCCADLHREGKVWQEHRPIIAAADLLDAIDALHQPNKVFARACDTCREPWPCPTARLLHPKENS